VTVHVEMNRVAKHVLKVATKVALVVAAVVRVEVMAAVAAVVVAVEVTARHKVSANVSTLRAGQWQPTQVQTSLR
jgi:hypothetical protein